MFKKSLQNNKVVRLIAIVLTVAMLMTTCLVQAFAEEEIEPRVSGTLQGYSVYASFGRVSGYNSRFNVYTLTDVNMGVYCKRGTIIYQPAHAGEAVIVKYTSATASYYGYELNIPVRLEDGVASNATPISGGAPVVFSYNGGSIQLSAML